MIEPIESTYPEMVPAKVRIDIGAVITELSLDLTEELHSVLGVPTLADARTAKNLFRDVIREAGKPAFVKYLYPVFLHRLRAAENPRERAVLEWVGRVGGGGEAANPGLARWLSLRYPIRNALRDGTLGLDGQALEDVAAFNQLVLDEIDHRGFQDRCTMIRNRPVVSDWDRETFVRHGYVLGDEATGADPLLTLSFVNDGEGFRRAIESFDLARHPHFPFEALQQFGQRWVDENYATTPKPVVPDLRSVE